MSSTSKGWIGVDLDGTLAYHAETWKPPEVGAPIMPMVERVRKWLADGEDVRIVTARVAPSNQNIKDWDYGAQYQAIEEFCLAQFGKMLPITWGKDHHMRELWDDRAVEVVRNTGLSLKEFLETQSWNLHQTEILRIAEIEEGTNG